MNHRLLLTNHRQKPCTSHKSDKAMRFTQIIHKVTCFTQIIETAMRFTQIPDKAMCFTQIVSKAIHITQIIDKAFAGRSFCIVTM